MGGTVISLVLSTKEFYHPKNITIMSSSTSDKLKGNWNIIKGKLKAKYADLTEDDLLYEEGKEDELIGKIQKRTGQAKENIKDFIDSI